MEKEAAIAAFIVLFIAYALTLIAYFKANRRAETWKRKAGNSETRADYWFNTTVEALSKWIVDYASTRKAFKRYEAARAALHKVAGIDVWKEGNLQTCDEERAAFAALGIAVRTGSDPERKGKGGQVSVPKGAPEGGPVRPSTYRCDDPGCEICSHQGREADSSNPQRQG